MLWEDGENYGDRWNEAMVSLPNNVTDDNEYNIQIKAFVGPSGYGNGLIFIFLQLLILYLNEVLYHQTY